VRDLPSSRTFYEAIGTTNNPHFRDDTSACMVFSDTIHVMLLTHAKRGVVTRKPIPDAHVTSEVMLAPAQSRASVNEITDAAARAGGGADINPPQDHGFMFGRSFEDPDGHVWEIVWMDPAAIPAGG
jgi:uncharacterized protein